MELMDMKDYDIDFKEKRTNGYLIATLFIIVGHYCPVKMDK